MDKNEFLDKIVREFSSIEGVEGITLAGSTVFDTADENSDLDIDVYISKDIDITKRREIAVKFAEYMEIGNNFWGPGDEWKLKGSQVIIDIIYLDINWINEYLEKLLVKHEVSVGYTTCFWHNVIASEILFDRNDVLKNLQQKYNISYPKELKQNIIDKNYPILRKNISSYYYQIEKAILRDDKISINHRVAGLLASYTDIIFAINEIRNPGEKKLMRIMNNKCKKLPEQMEENINNILNYSATLDKQILIEINQLVDNLEILLVSEKLQSSC